MRCKDKIAVVTGCTNGIGLATAEQLLKEGAELYMLVRRTGYGEEVAAQFNKQYPGKVRKVIFFDASKLESIEPAFNAVFDDARRIDIFVNNSINDGSAKVGDNTTVTGTGHDTYKSLTEGILGVSAECLRVVIPLMIKGGGGSIVNVSSSTSTQPDLTRTYYGVAKAAVNALTQYTAVQYGRQGIRCNAVLPGFTVAQSTKNALPESFKEQWLKHALIRRLGDPEDQAKAIVFFASDDSSWITGQLLEVCGGYGLAAPMFGDTIEPSK